MKIYFENGVTPPNVQILPDSDPTPTGYTEDTSIANFFDYGTQYGLTNVQVVEEIINLITDWSTFPAADKLRLQELADWHLTALTLGDAIVGGGVAIYIAPSGGNTYTFPDNGTVRYNIGLRRNEVPYDGSELKITISYQLFSAPSAPNEIQFSGKYLFAEDGDDNYDSPNAVAFTPHNWAIGSIPAREERSEEVFTLSGPAGAKVLQLTLEKDPLSGTPNYTGDFDVYSILIEKV